MAAAASVMWLDVLAGGADDMLLGPLIDAARSLEFTQAQVDRVLPDAVVLSATTMQTR